MAGVVLRDVWKRFGETVAVERANLEIHDQEFVVLVGPSGCGKSTTLRMVAGLEEISEGEILIGDRVVNRVSPKDRNIAMVFQNYALYPHWSVFENMAFGLKIRKMPKDEIRRKVQEAADILDIGHLLERKPKALSGGQRQRVAMGRAIVRDPEVFLFDEPLSNLDAKLRVQMRVEISRLHNRLKTTVLYVTHDQVEAMTLADRIVIMSEARIQQVGTPLELFNHPSNLFVAGFIGSPAMNFLEGTLEDGAVKVLDHVFPVDPALGLRAGDPVTLGIRPHRVVPVDRGGPGRLEARVDVVELMGAENYAYLRDAKDGALTVRLEAGTILEEGSLQWFDIPAADTYVFGPDGRNLGMARAGGAE